MAVAVVAAAVASDEQSTQSVTTADTPSSAAVAVPTQSTTETIGKQEENTSGAAEAIDTVSSETKLAEPVSTQSDFVPIKIGSEWRQRLEASGIQPEGFPDKATTIKFPPGIQRELEARKHFFFARRYLAMEEPAHALGEFRAALDEDPDNTQIMLGIVAANVAARHLEDAEEMLDAILRKDASNVRALIYKAQILVTQSEQSGNNSSKRKELLNEATSIFERARRTQPKNLEVLKGLAAAYVAQHNIGRIVQTYRDILGVKPNDTYSLLILANVLAKTGHQQEAVQYYERVIEQRRGFVNGYIYLAQLYEEMGRNSDAIDTYKRALLIEPRNEQLLRRFDLLLTKLNTDRGGSQGVLRQYEKFAKEYPFSSEIQRLYADQLAVTKDYDGAVRQYRHVLELDPENVEAMTAIGNICLQKKDYEEATKYFSKAVEISPDRVDIYESIATSLLSKDAKGRSNAEDVYKRAIKLNPKVEKLYLNLALLYEQDGRNREALQVLESALPFVGEKSDFLALVGKYYEAFGDNAKALDFFERAHKTTPDSRQFFAKYLSALIKYRQPQQKIDEVIQRALETFQDKGETYSMIGETYFDAGDMQNAILFYGKAAVEDNQKVAYYARLVQLYNLQKDYEKSIEFLNKAKETLKDSQDVQRLIAETYLQRKDFARGIEVYRKMLEAKPDWLEGYQLLADAYNRAGKPEDALGAIRLAEASLGKSDDTEEMRGMILYQQKRYDPAERIFRDLIQKGLVQRKTQKMDDYYYFLGSIQLEQKRYEVAEKSFRKAIETNPLNDSALNALGYMFADTGKKLDEAKTLVQRALEINPSAPHIIDSLGWINFRQGKIKEAQELVEKAARLMGEDAEVFEHLGDIYQARGDTPRALDFWKRSLSLDKTRAAVRSKISSHEK